MLVSAGRGGDTQLINNPAESPSPPHTPLLYLGLLGDADSDAFVGLSGTLRCLVVPKTVITLQVSNLAKHT